MSEFMMLMKGTTNGDDWTNYIEMLINTGKFRGGSELANGRCVSKAGTGHTCTVSGFMRFEANTIEEVLDLLPGNPVYEAGGDIEVLEIVVS